MTVKSTIVSVAPAGLHFLCNCTCNEDYMEDEGLWGSTAWDKAHSAGGYAVGHAVPILSLHSA